MRGRDAGAAGPVPFLLALGLLGSIGDASAVTPEQVVSVSPARASIVAPPVVVEAVLDLSRGAMIDPGTLRVLLDGRDVTDACGIAMSRDVPPSRLELRCPGLDLDPGSHEVALTSTLRSGAEAAYTWRFELRAP